MGLDGERELGEPLGGHEPAVGDAAREVRSLRPEQLLPDGGVDAVGADEDGDLGCLAVLELERHVVALSTNPVSRWSTWMRSSGRPAASVASGRHGASGSAGSRRR
jgi:hypothetical protein